MTERCSWRSPTTASEEPTRRRARDSAVSPTGSRRSAGGLRLQVRRTAERSCASRSRSMAAEGGSVRAFLIADIRGFTRFTHDRGDEEAARVARRFGALTEDTVGPFAGTLLELRGDEALVVFDSTRSAIRAAIELQGRYVADDETEALPVGIGIAAGEAVPVGEGYRGGALNLAARLCGIAGAGEIIVSQEL